MQMLRRLWLCFLISVVALGSPALTKQRPTFNQVVIFGDSLSDIGNAGRYSNGPVWTEILATKLGLMLRPSGKQGSNFAVGGARIKTGPHSLRAQVDQFLASQRRSSKTLYVVWGGGNDVLTNLGAADALSELNVAAETFGRILDDLLEHGASDLLIPNLPNVGMTPEVRSHGAAAVDKALQLTNYLNEAIEEKIVKLQADYPDRNFYRFDVAGMAQRAQNDPAEFGFTNIRTPCQSLSGCSGYLFWDSIHPTAQAHERLASAALGLLLNPR
jgi:phospholipase/lecithinase/hemolysin